MARDIIDPPPPPGADQPPSNTVQPTIGVNPTAIQAVLISLALAVAAGVSIATTVAAFWKARDLSAFINYIRGSDFLTGLATVSAGVTTGVIVIRSIVKHGQRVKLARSSPIGFVKGEPIELPPIRAPEPETPAPRLISKEEFLRGTPGFYGSEDKE